MSLKQIKKECVTPIIETILEHVTQDEAEKIMSVLDLYLEKNTTQEELEMYLETKMEENGVSEEETSQIIDFINDSLDEIKSYQKINPLLEAEEDENDEDEDENDEDEDENDEDEGESYSEKRKRRGKTVKEALRSKYQDDEEEDDEESIDEMMDSEDMEDMMDDEEEPEPSKKKKKKTESLEEMWSKQNGIFLGAGNPGAGDEVDFFDYQAMSGKTKKRSLLGNEDKFSDNNPSFQPADPKLEDLDEGEEDASDMDFEDYDEYEEGKTRAKKRGVYKEGAAKARYMRGEEGRGYEDTSEEEELPEAYDGMSSVFLKKKE